MNSAIILVLLFVAASAVRDVYFGEVFQRLEFFAVVLTAFSLTTVIFLSFVIVRGRSQFAAMRAAWREIAVLAFDALSVDNAVAGPAIIEQPYASIFLPAGWRAQATAFQDIQAERVA